jgi:superfamily II DNA or RNA helicase
VTALASWKDAGRRGVVEAATGTGKTAVAFAAIEQLRDVHGDALRVAIVVPTKVLARQWRTALETEVGIPRSFVGEQHSAAKTQWTPQHPVLVTVLDTARRNLAVVLKAWQGKPVLLVVDECHRAGSEHNAKIFDQRATYTLGLSATPERDDNGHVDHVYPGLGQPVYRYPLLDALDDGVLAPLTSINLYVDFTSAELVAWEDLRDQIRQAIRKLEWEFPELELAGADFLKSVGRLAEREHPTALRLMALLAERRELLATAEGRVACQRTLLRWLAGTDDRALVFHETIKSAEASRDELLELSVPVSIDHSKLNREERDGEEQRFRSKISRVYVAVRALDEGVDVPDASVAVIAAGSRSRRQRIQRFGRVLRHEADKKAIVVSILVRGTPEEAGVGGRDASIVGPLRVRHHRWPGVPIESALVAPDSTYKPATPDFTMEEMISMIDLGLLTDEMAAKLREARVARVQSGGYSAVVAEYSPNAWHAVDEVRGHLGMPDTAFDQIRADIRRSFRPTLDPAHRNDPAFIHGQEIAACVRTWERQRRQGRRRK